MYNCMKLSKPKSSVLKCQKLNIDGTVCGKAYGFCIHKWIPTRFGANTNV